MLNLPSLWLTINLNTSLDHHITADHRAYRARSVGTTPKTTTGG